MRSAQEIICRERQYTHFIFNNVFPETLAVYETITEIYGRVVGKPEGRRPLGRPRRRWEDNIKMDLRGIGWGGMDWINVAQDRDRWRAVVNAVMNLRFL
jgi:hypothetical protein